MRPFSKLGSTNMQFNVGKIKSKKTAKKVLKLKEFASNSFSYLQVVIFESKLKLHSVRPQKAAD